MPEIRKHKDSARKGENNAKKIRTGIRKTAAPAAGSAKTAGIVKKGVSIVLACGLGVGAIAGGMVIYRNVNKKPVPVYEMSDFCITDYYADQSESYGMVTTQGIQKIEVSSTQTITEIYVQEGQEVKAGDKLLSYDTTLTDLDVKRAELSVQKQELSLTKAKKELVEIQAMKPYSGGSSGGGGTSGGSSEKKETPAEEKDTRVAETPVLMSGSGTEEDPYIYLVPEDWTFDQKTLSQMYYGVKEVKDSDEKDTEDDTEQETEQDTEADTEESTEENTEQDTEADTENPSEETTEDAEENTESDGSRAATFTTASADPDKTVYVIATQRDGDMYGGDLTEGWGLTLKKDREEIVLGFFTPDLTALTDDQEEDSYEDSWTDDSYTDTSSGYTSAEIAQMRTEKENEIRDLNVAIQLARIDLQKKQKELNDGAVYAEYDGTVTVVRDATEAYEEDKPVMEVSGGGGYYIECTMSELELGTVEVGQTVDVSSWMTGAYCQGTITAISDYPDTSDSGYTYGNSNVSYYPFTVFVEGDADLEEYDYVDVTYSAAQEDTDSWYIESMFIRTENGNNYAYVLNQDTGCLEKKAVVVGKSLYGSYTQIRSGITMDDYIAFPYGDAADGAKAQITDVSEFYSNY